MEITRNAAQYANHNDSLAACAADVAEAFDVEGYDLAPEWDDESRERIRLTLPRHVGEKVREFARIIGRGDITAAMATEDSGGGDSEFEWRGEHTDALANMLRMPVREIPEEVIAFAEHAYENYIEGPK